MRCHSIKKGRIVSLMGTGKIVIKCKHEAAKGLMLSYE